MLREYIWLAWTATLLCKLVVPMMVTPFSTDRLAGLAELAVAALLGGEIDDDRAGLHGAHHVGRDEDRRAFAGDERGGDDGVGFGDVFLQHLGLLAFLFFGDLFGVAAGRRGVPYASTSTNLAPRLSTCSLTTLRTSNASTTAPSRRAVGDGLQTRDARAEHEHLGGRDGSGGGHEHGEELGQRGRGEEHAVVTGRRRLRAQDVHALRERRARDHVRARWP